MSGFNADGSDNFAIDGISDSDNPLLGPLEGAPTFNVPPGVNPMTYEPGGLAPSLVVTPNGGSTVDAPGSVSPPAAGSSWQSWLQYLFSPGGAVIPQAEGAGANPYSTTLGVLTGGLLGGETGGGGGGGWEAWAGEAIIRGTISIVGLVLVGSGFYLAGRRGGLGAGQLGNPAPVLRALR